MSWPKNKGINRHGKQKRGTAVCSAGKEVSMEKKRNRHKRSSKKISEKIGKKRNVAAAFILAGMIAVIVMVAVAARTKMGILQDLFRELII